MKIKIDLPWGREFYVEKEPISEDRFEKICVTVVVLAVLALMYGLFTSPI